MQDNEPPASQDDQPDADAQQCLDDKEAQQVRSELYSIK